MDQSKVFLISPHVLKFSFMGLKDAPDFIDGLYQRNQTCFQSALDNVRNLVGSPLAGIDDYQMVDTRDLCNALNDLISLDPVTGTRGNPVYGCLP